MAKGLYSYEGNTLNYRNETGADIEYCDVLSLTTCIGVAQCDIPMGELGAVRVAGVFELPAAAADVFEVGASIYWDTTAGTVTATETGNTPCGFVAEAKKAGSTVALVKIG